MGELTLVNTDLFFLCGQFAAGMPSAILNTYTIIEGHCLGIVIPTTNNRWRTLQIPIPRFKHDRLEVQAAKPEFNHVIVQPVNTCLNFDLEHSVRLGGIG